MKVYKLIEELMKLPAGTDVRCVSDLMVAGDTDCIDASEVDEGNGFVRIFFKNDNPDFEEGAN